MHILTFDQEFLIAVSYDELSSALDISSKTSSDMFHQLRAVFDKPDPVKQQIRNAVIDMAHGWI